MRAPLRLALSICSARRSRFILLSAAVALSVVLITAIACSMSSINHAFEAQINAQVGTAEIRIRPTSGDTMPEGILRTISTWDGVHRVIPRLQGTLSISITLQAFIADEASGEIRASDQRVSSNVFINGIDPEIEPDARPVELLAGRFPKAKGEILLDARVAQRLSWVYVQRQSNGGVGTLLDDPVGYLREDSIDVFPPPLKH